MDDEDGHFIPAEDVTWARNGQADGTLAKKARVAGDLLSVGDVVLVRAVTNDDGTFNRWSLRQVPEVQGAFMAMDVNTGRVIATRAGSATRIRCSTPQAAQARLQLQAHFVSCNWTAGSPPPSSSTRQSESTPRDLWTPKNASGKYYGPTPLHPGS